MSTENTSNLLSQVQEALGKIPEKDVEALVDAIVEVYRRSGTVFLMGNGGSAASCSHLACDLRYAQGKEYRFRVVGLTENTPLLTAVANDLGYDKIFSVQLSQLLKPEDVVLAISVSGDSSNIVEALRYARESGAVTLGFLGSGGGAAAAYLDHAVLLESGDFTVVESAHSVLTQLVADSFRKKI